MKLFDEDTAKTLSFHPGDPTMGVQFYKGSYQMAINWYKLQPVEGERDASADRLNKLFIPPGGASSLTLVNSTIGKDVR